MNLQPAGSPSDFGLSSLHNHVGQPFEINLFLYFFLSLFLSLPIHVSVCIIIYMFSIKLHVCLVTQSCLTLCDHMDCSLPGSSVHGDSPGKNTGVGCHSLLQHIFPTWGWNPGLLHCRQILYRLSHEGSLKITCVCLYVCVCVYSDWFCFSREPWLKTRIKEARNVLRKFQQLALVACSNSGSQHRRP